MSEEVQREEIADFPAGYRAEFETVIADDWDGIVKEDVADRIRHEQVIVEHNTYDFIGYVWFKDGMYHEQVWRYKAPVAQFAAADYGAVMERANYGFGLVD